MSWTCATCGVEHDELPTCFGAAAPWRELVPEDEHDGRVLENADVCIVDGAVVFVRGHIVLPIRDSDQTFEWSVWVSLSQASFDDMHTRWDDADRHARYFGWLCTTLPTYPPTVNLAANVVVRDVGLVPLIELQDSDHPLAAEQRDGITWDRVAEIAHVALGH